MWVLVYVWEYRCLRRPGISDLSEAELQAVVSHQTWVLGIEPGSSAGVVQACDHHETHSSLTVFSVTTSQFKAARNWRPNLRAKKRSGVGNRTESHSGDFLGGPDSTKERCNKWKSRQLRTMTFPNCLPTLSTTDPVACLICLMEAPHRQLLHTGAVLMG